MALFRGGSDKPSKSEALRRVLEGRFTDREELSRALQELARFRDLKPEELLPLLSRSDATIRTFAQLQIGRRLDARSIEALLKRARTMSSRMQSLLLHTLLKARLDLALPACKQIVAGDDPELASQALEALSSLPGAAIGQEFIAFLSHDRADVRYMALVKLQESPEFREQLGIQRTLLGMASDEDPRIRLRTLDLLDDIDPTEAVRLCLGHLDDSSAQVQQRAVHALASSLDRLQSSTEAEDELLALLTDGSEAIRSGVLDILMKRPNKELLLRKLLVFCKDTVGWMRDRTLASLRQYTEELTEPVIRLMSDPEEDIRSMALQLGATLEAPEAVPHIVRLLENDDWWLRMIAAETLGKIGDSRAIPALVKATENPACGLAAIQALSRIGGPDVVAPIARQLSSPEVENRVEALDALEVLSDPRVLPVLEQCSQRDPSLAVRDRASRLFDLLSGDRLATDSRAFHIPEMHRNATLEGLSPMETLLVQTRERGASDLHLVVGSPPIVRLHGRLTPLEHPILRAEQTEALLDSLLTPSDRHSLVQQHQVDFCHAIRDVGRYRCNVYQERKGLAASFRVIPNEVPTLAQIRVPEHLGDLVNHHQGLVVVAGPSGSGKSTTLAALVNLFNEQRRSHILLLEDPIEFVHAAKGCLVTQRQVNRHTESFSSALRGALRQDPDIIVVGQMRDPETVRLAIEASETGHLVIGTMNTTSAPKTVDRIVDSFPIAEQAQIRTMLSETLKVVICQNLLPEASGWGRVACFEVMMGTLDIRMLIRDNKMHQVPGQMQIGERSGHVTLDKALARLLDDGRITAELAWQRAQDKSRFEARLAADTLPELDEGAAP